ncbi:hypothetical protein V2G26_009848 [Clonostachys chloroleuca]|uniref:Uncharacterized protein n=2 Tax=Clonostachys TaxID=110564 RepID=A0AA35Q294_9HYPO|nr:unnamed protein product [Clonostachys chloroleuca]
MASIFSLRGLSRQPLLSGVASSVTRTSMAPIRLLSTTTTLLSKAAKRAKAAKIGTTPRRNKGHQRSEFYARVKILKQNLFSPAPPPLRMARLRHLRHWTIHRAWLLFRRQQKEATHRERVRMNAGMFNACEELRKVAGPGDRSEGYLYRVAMEKKGVWGLNAVPIEYARFQTDSPATTAWNHDWKR